MSFLPDTIYEIGDLSMVSTRNIDKSTEYKELRTYAGISSVDVQASISSGKKGIIKKKNPIIKQVDMFKGSTLEDAINKVVRSVPGGEFLYNANFYIVEQANFRFDSEKTNVGRWYIVTGDVWGANEVNAGIKGYHVDDKVVFIYSKDLKKRILKEIRENNTLVKLLI